MKQLIESLTVAEYGRDVLLKCRAAVQAIDPRAEVILYGSRARGDAAPDSDYDLLIVTNGPATLEQEDLLRRRIYPVELDTGAVLTVVLVNRGDWNSPLY